MFTNGYQDRETRNRSNDYGSIVANEKNRRADEELQEEKKEKVKIVAICIILILIFIGMLLITAGIKAIQRELHVREQQLEYEVSFQESKLMVDAMVEISWKYWDGKLAVERWAAYGECYEKINLGLKYYQEISEELLNEYNDSIRNIFGDETKYFLESKEDRDIEGFKDGIAFWICEYNVEHAFEKGEISEDEYHKYKEYKDRVLSDISHKEVEKLIEYMNYLTNVEYHEESTF